MSRSTKAASADTMGVLTYFTPLSLLVFLVVPQGYMVDIATSYMLKNQLHASASAVASFRFLSAVLVYFSIMFGLTRDLWNPFGLRDRGYFLIFAPMSAVIFVWMAYTQLSYTRLLVGMLLVMFTFRLVVAAYQGLTALIGQERSMTGRLGVLFVVASLLPSVLGAMASGWIAGHLPPRQTFLLMAVLALVLAMLGLWKPRAVFSHAYDQPVARGLDLFGDIKRLLKHRAIYPTTLILLMFQFAPGQNTPLQFYLTNTLHAPDSAYSNYCAITLAAFLPVALLYGYLCRRVPLNKLLWWGAILTIPQMIPLAFIHSGREALWCAVPIGLMGSLASPAYADLSMRACPPGMQGSLMMLIDGFGQLSGRGGDILGSWIYNSDPAHGFLYCVIVTTAVYILILPLLLLVPKDLIATTDGQPDALPETVGLPGLFHANGDLQEAELPK